MVQSTVATCSTSCIISIGVSVVAVCMVKMKASLFAMFAISAIFFGGLCIMLTSANPTSDLKAKLKAMDKLFSQKLLNDRAVLSQQPPSLVPEKREAKTTLKQQRKVKVRTPREVIVETEDDRMALNQLFARLMKNETNNQDMYMSDEDEAKIKNSLLKMKQRFDSLGSKLKGGFNCFETRVKNVFQENG